MESKSLAQNRLENLLEFLQLSQQIHIQRHVLYGHVAILGAQVDGRRNPGYLMLPEVLVLGILVTLSKKKKNSVRQLLFYAKCQNILNAVEQLALRFS